MQVATASTHMMHAGGAGDRARQLDGEGRSGGVEGESAIQMGSADGGRGRARGDATSAYKEMVPCDRCFRMEVRGASGQRTADPPSPARPPHDMLARPFKANTALP
ncbi:hypothetical protein WOLCODRAFT_147306 [Wolfiporia cocos MD-104 SS10]|uniref:Uncharacterized protein n=1 Tax=Wolfiporia cocos (strain MD-104) TaxID=742152 RepID=A0A2H3J6B3_WOLCO|nr:hypothetical protein WOLCODRAFT_147306 [Wolfiporia cocos MD-104 SS10]